MKIPLTLTTRKFVKSSSRMIQWPNPGIAVTMAVLSLGLAAQSQTINQSEASGSFGSLSQYNSSITYANTLNVQPVACVPTSFANALTYLNTVNGGTVFQNSPNNYATVNTLAQDMGTSLNPTLNGGANGGTGYAPAVNGFLTYAGGGVGQNLAPSVNIFGEYSTAAWGIGLPNGGAGFVQAKPSAYTLGAALSSQCAIELGIQWGTYSGTTFTPDPLGGFHAVVMRSENLVNGAGFFGIIDPISGADVLNDPNASAQFLPVSVTTVDGFLYLTYPTQLPDNPAEGSNDSFAAPNGESARVVADWVEFVPDSTSTLPLLGIALLGLGGLHRLTRRQISIA